VNVSLKKEETPGLLEEVLHEGMIERRNVKDLKEENA